MVFNCFKSTLCVALLIVSVKAIAQDSKLSLEVNYPITFGNSYIGEAYDGIVDVGANYRLSELNFVTIGTSLNAGVYKLQDDISPQLIDAYVYMIQPRAFGELNIETLPRLHPKIGAGYTLVIYNLINSEPFANFDSNTETEGAINLNFSLAFDISSRLYIQAQYDFITFDFGFERPNPDIDDNFNIFKAGLGYRF